MWLLLLVLHWPGFPEKVTVLNSFDTQHACQVERDKIGFAMAEAYPFDHDYSIQCRIKARVI